MHDHYGTDLEKRLAVAEKKGYEVTGDRLKTAPRGFDKNHPKIELLRHKSIHLGRTIGFDDVIHTSALVDEVKKDWRATRPLVEWIAEHAIA